MEDINKWNKKYLKLAKTLAEDNTSCYSRQIGSVLVSDQNFIISVGYNGAAIGVPHVDTKEYIEYLSGILLEEDWFKLQKRGINTTEDLVKNLENCKTCPRKFLNIKSGDRLYLCPCSHSERNCIFSAAANGSSTVNSTIYCYCQCPCMDCCIAIIQAKIKKVVCCDFNHELYNLGSPGLLKMANINLEVIDPETFETKKPDKWWISSTS